jgi:hypothetical protein
MLIIETNPEGIPQALRGTVAGCPVSYDQPDADTVRYWQAEAKEAEEGVCLWVCAASTTASTSSAY